MINDFCEMYNLKKHLKREGNLSYISLKNIFLLQLSLRYFNSIIYAIN